MGAVHPLYGVKAVDCALVRQVTPEPVDGVGRVGDDRSILESVYRAADLARFGMVGVDREQHRVPPSRCRLPWIDRRVTRDRAAKLSSSMVLAQLELSVWFVRAVAFVWGCLWASFVNVVVHRVPREMSVVRPASHCPACGAPVRAWDNLPVLSFLVLRGRARCCGARISPRYVVVEALSGLLALAVYEVVVRGLPEEASLALTLSVFLTDFGLALALLAAAFIDAEHMYLPDAITVGG